MIDMVLMNSSQPLISVNGPCSSHDCTEILSLAHQNSLGSMFYKGAAGYEVAVKMA